MKINDALRLWSKVRSRSARLSLAGKGVAEQRGKSRAPKEILAAGEKVAAGLEELRWSE